jgi:hypothetical protein
MQRAKMLAAQWKAPLQPEQGEKYTRQQRSANIIDQRNSLHGLLLTQRCDFIIARGTTAMHG